jgi:hypothetical protein
MQFVALICQIKLARKEAELEERKCKKTLPRNTGKNASLSSSSISISFPSVPRHIVVVKQSNGNWLIEYEGRQFIMSEERDASFYGEDKWLLEAAAAGLRAGFGSVLIKMSVSRVGNLFLGVWGCNNGVLRTLSVVFFGDLF